MVQTNKTQNSPCTQKKFAVIFRFCDVFALTKHERFDF